MAVISFTISLLSERHSHRMVAVPLVAITVSIGVSGNQLHVETIDPAAVTARANSYTLAPLRELLCK